MLNWFENLSHPAQAWVVVGVLAALTVLFMIIREIPAMRRESKIFSM
ncbi:MAG TPA: hypothetical protein VHB20_03240 [Verrucomicrobiae bacterium]|jgi:hypothetical protein|nr:hypothetical protein [Verrucomicrobiae bacterium]